MILLLPSSYPSSSPFQPHSKATNVESLPQHSDLLCIQRPSPYSSTSRPYLLTLSYPSLLTAPSLSYLHLHLLQQQPSSTFSSQCLLLLTTRFLPKESSVYIIDHTWTFRLSDALKQLKEVPGFTERMATLMCVDFNRESDSTAEHEEELNDDNERRKKILDILEREMEKAKERSSDSAAWLELKELGIDDDMLASLGLSSKFPDLVALNLWGNKLKKKSRKIQNSNT